MFGHQCGLCYNKKVITLQEAIQPLHLKVDDIWYNKKVILISSICVCNDIIELLVPERLKLATDSMQSGQTIRNFSEQFAAASSSLPH